jgi:hypothetical protein
MTLFDGIYDRVTAGTIGNWLAIIGLLSLMYWAWLIVQALRRRKAVQPAAVAAGADAAPTAARTLPETDQAADDIAVIAAAVQAILGAHRMVLLAPEGGDSHWANEGRWMQQMSHQVR